MWSVLYNGNVQLDMWKNKAWNLTKLEGVFDAHKDRKQPYGHVVQYILAKVQDVSAEQDIR